MIHGIKLSKNVEEALKIIYNNASEMLQSIPESPGGYEYIDSRHRESLREILRSVWKIIDNIEGLNDDTIKYYIDLFNEKR